MAAGKRAVVYLDPTGLAVKAAENPSVQVLREKFADEHAVGVICWMEVDSKVENKQKRQRRFGSGGHSGYAARREPG